MFGCLAFSAETVRPIRPLKAIMVRMKIRIMV
jgi:hypothetical protein